MVPIFRIHCMVMFGLLKVLDWMPVSRVFKRIYIWGSLQHANFVSFCAILCNHFALYDMKLTWSKEGVHWRRCKVVGCEGVPTLTAHHAETTRKHIRECSDRWNAKHTEVGLYVLHLLCWSGERSSEPTWPDTPCLIHLCMPQGLCTCHPKVCMTPFIST